MARRQDLGVREEGGGRAGDNKLIKNGCLSVHMHAAVSA